MEFTIAVVVSAILAVDEAPYIMSLFMLNGLILDSSFIYVSYYIEPQTRELMEIMHKLASMFLTNAPPVLQATLYFFFIFILMSDHCALCVDC